MQPSFNQLTRFIFRKVQNHFVDRQILSIAQGSIHSTSALGYLIKASPQEQPLASLEDRVT